MLQFSEYTIYGDGDVENTDGERSDLLESYSNSLSYRINWDEFGDDADLVAVVKVYDDKCSGTLLPDERVVCMWLDDTDWKTGKNNLY